MALAICTASALTADLSKLPPPAVAPIDFAKDIQPILETSCLRCHGAVKPKGGLRLDRRDAALRGGTSGPALLPGRSAESRLIHAVARLDAATHMPPPGKGDPLTAEQSGKLRAWIYQGVKWDEAAASPQPKIEFSVAPAIRAISVSGNEAKFREHTGLRPGVSGGAANFSFVQQLDADTRLSLSGRAMPRDEDYAVKLSLERRDAGFVRAEFAQWRRYSDDTGGSFARFATPSFRLGRELFMDGGRAAFEAGLTLPDWPRVTLGYEYQFREGAESTLHWGDSTQAGVTKNIYPALRFVDEWTHILKLDLEHDWRDTHIEDNARVEFYDLRTRKEQAAPGSAFGGTVTPATFVLVREQASHWQGQNALRRERQLTDWLFGSAGYLYSRMEGDARFQMSTVTAAGAPAATGEQWFANQIMLDRESHLFSATALAGPWANLSFSGVVQGEWTRQSGFGDENRRMVFFNFPFADPVTVRSELDVRSTTEQFGLRYTGVPHTALFLEGRLQQEERDNYEQQFGGMLNGPFLRRTDTTKDLREFRAGWHTAPVVGLTWSTSYRRREQHTDYANSDYAPPAAGPYPGFLRQRASWADEVETRLAWRAANWWKLSVGYRLAATDYQTATAAFPGLPAATPGGAVFAANHDAHTFSMGHTLTPFRRWTLNAGASYTDSRASSAQNGVAAVAPWRGSIVSATGGATFAWTANTDLRLSHAYSRADYAQNNFVGGLPAGLEYDQHSLQLALTTRLKRGATVNVQYGFNRYAEPTGGGAYDYTAHSLLGTLTLKWPGEP
ncbi:MAG: c-type cytochrome domain-containing protein [Limisphaerales bacterium]